MYAYIKGTLEETGEDYIVVEAGGIGYQIFTTGQTFQYLPSMGEEVKVYTYLHVREDAMILFGFLTKNDNPVQNKAKGAKNEAIEALVALGYSSSEALKALNGIEITDDTDVEDILKAALKNMAFM